MNRGSPVRSFLALTVVGIVVVLTCRHPSPNHAPNPPGIPNGPTDCLARVQYSYSTSATDPDGDSVSCEFDFGKGDTVGWTRLVPSATPCSALTMWYTDSNYMVRVRARDQHFAVSDWSAELSIAIGNSAPSTPEFDYFPNTVWPGTIDSVRIVSIDPDNDRLRYVVEWGTDATADTYDFEQNGTLKTYGRHWLIPGSYPVRVLALDSHGRPSDWSAPRTITVPGPALLWRYEVGSAVNDAPALGPDGTVYFKTDNWVFALNPDGTLKWQYRIVNWRLAPVSVSPKNTIYVRSNTKELLAISSAGELAWTTTFRSAGSTTQMMTSALGMNGTVYHRADSLYALDAQGTQLWRSNRGIKNNGPVAIGADDAIYFQSEQRDSLYALNPDGSLRWGVQHYGANRYAPPVIGQDGMVILCGGAHSLAAFSALGTSLWSLDLSGPVKALPPAVGPGGMTYWGGDDGLSAITPTGWWLWRFPTRSEVLTTPAITADTTIIFGCNDNLLRGVGPDGTIRWAFGTRGSVRSSPVIAPDGTIYFGSDDGYLYAIEGHSPLADSPWPMFHHDPQHTGRAR